MVPRVSVVIPAYGVASYIGETLASVFAQTFEDREVIEREGITGVENKNTSLAKIEFESVADDLWGNGIRASQTI